MNIAHLDLKHPTGRRELYKFKTPHFTHEKIKMHYYSSPHHFRTEAMVVRVVKIIKMVEHMGSEKIAHSMVHSGFKGGLFDINSYPIDIRHSL